MSLHVIFEIVALICLILAAINIPVSRVSLGWLGMAFWLLAELLSSGGIFLR
jgi:hypothetical protein